MADRQTSPAARPPERDPIHVLWVTSGLGCDGESVALTAATSPSLEDLLRGCLPGLPPVVLYNPLIAYENGEEFMAVFHQAKAGLLAPFILVLEGAVANEEINGEGHWAAFGVDQTTGQPILTTAWLDALAPRAAAVVAMGTCAAYGGIPAMRNNPTGAMGLGDYLGAGWTSSRGVPVVNLPGCPVAPDNITETLLCLVLHLADMGPPLELDDQGRPRRIFVRTVHESCDRSGLAAAGQFAREPGEGLCLVKLGCAGPVVHCNVPIRGWVNGVGGCPNVGGICIACTMPGFPDRFMPFMEPDAGARMYARTARLAHAPLIRFLRARHVRRSHEQRLRLRERERGPAGH